jgi:dTDP-4-amino-4,6-dideoxygalactose transaminase
MRLHGINRTAWDRGSRPGASWQYEIVAPGFKYNMTDIAAAMGLAQLRKVDVMWQRRREIARRYTAAFEQLPELDPPRESAPGEHAWHLYLLRLHSDRLTIDRDECIEQLHARNIGTSVHFIPLHLHPYYRDLYGYQPETYPVAYREYARSISMPIYSAMSDRDVDDVIEAVTDIVGRTRRAAVTHA